MREGRGDCRVQISSEYDEMAPDYECVMPHAQAGPIKLTYNGYPYNFDRFAHDRGKGISQRQLTRNQRCNNYRDRRSPIAGDESPSEAQTLRFVAESLRQSGPFRGS